MVYKSRNKIIIVLVDMYKENNSIFISRRLSDARRWFVAIENNI
jgi:hypothetical protein